MTQKPPQHPLQRVLSAMIFSSRWLQAPLYLGLIISQCIYVYQFVLELVHLVTDISHMKPLCHACVWRIIRILLNGCLM